jgi:hypothetical protein
MTANAALAQERALFDRGNRFLDKPWPKAELTPSIVVADSFEDWAQVQKNWKFEGVKAEPSTEHVADGKGSIKLEFAGPQSALKYVRGSRGWGSGIPSEEELMGLRALHFDELRMEIFNPGDPVKMVVTSGNVLDSKTVYAQIEMQLKSGANSVVIQTADLRKQVYRVSDIPQSLTFSLAGISTPRTLFVDYVRWVGPGLGKNLIKYAKCIQFCEPALARPYFQAVDAGTAYTKERGCGWATPAKAGVPFSWQTPVFCEHLTGRRPDDPLFWSYLVLSESPLMVDLPAGKYRLQLVEHGIGFYEPRPYMYDLSVRVDDGQPQVLRQSAKTFAEVMQFEYGLDQTDWQPGFDMWQKYRGHLIRPIELDFEAKGGTCKLDIASNPRRFENMSFLIIYPVDKAEAIEPELAALWQDLRYRFTEGFAPATRRMAEAWNLPGLHEEFDNPEAGKARLAGLKSTDAEKQSGGIVYNRPGIEEVYPDTIPGREECGRPFEAAAPPGEIGSFAINLFAISDLKDVRLSLGSFVGPNDRKIPSQNADVSVVNCIPRMTGQQVHGDWRYMVVPWHLAKRPALDVARETSRRWWLNVDVPADTPSGTYVATATLEGKGLAKKEVKLKLEVLPFKLDPLPKDVEQAMVITPAFWGEWADWNTVSFTRTYVAYSHLEVFDKPENARWKGLFYDARKCVEARVPAELVMIKKTGLNCVYLGQHPHDPSSPEEKLSADGIKIVPYDVATTDQVAAQKAIFKGLLTKFTLEDVQKFSQGKTQPVAITTSSSPLGWSDVQEEAGIYRFMAGFFLWRLEAKGAIYGPWSLPWRDPYNPCDGHVSEWGDFCAPTSSPNQPSFNSTMILEGLREGVTDYRYVAMLERLIREKPDSQAAKGATEYLARLREQIHPEAKYYFKAVGDNKGAEIWGGWNNTWTQKDTAWNGDDYEHRRKELARHIIALQK